MKLKYQIKSSQLPDYNAILTNSFHICVNGLDYAEFYNAQCVLKMLADNIYRTNLTYRKKLNIFFSLDQYKTIRKMIAMSQKEVLPDIYQFVLINDLFAECERQVSTIKHKQDVFYNQFNSALLIGGEHGT